MSSQGSSSVRTISKIVFAPISGDLLSKELSTPSTSSTKSVLEVASSPMDRRAKKPECETTSTSGRQGEEEEDEVAVSCEDL